MKTMKCKTSSLHVRTYPYGPGMQPVQQMKVIKIAAAGISHPFGDHRTVTQGIFALVFMLGYQDQFSGGGIVIISPFCHVSLFARAQHAFIVIHVAEIHLAITHTSILCDRSVSKRRAVQTERPVFDVRLLRFPVEWCRQTSRPLPSRVCSRLFFALCFVCISIFLLCH